MIRNFADAHIALRAYYNQPGSNTYTLDRMRELMAYLGNPQNTLRIVHVAGTSGKTSTAYYISALLEQSGSTVGLTVGPHVNEVNERVQINHAPLPESEFCRALEEFLSIVKASAVKPSYFELLVAFAFWQFARFKVDYAVVEVGLGGLLDGTNVIAREDKVCAITDIGLDHTNVLGNTIPEITGQKAGIIYDHNHVFMHQQAAEVMEVVRAKCLQESAELHAVDSWDHVVPDMLPLFQKRNFSLALETAQYVLKRDGHAALTPSSIHTAATVHIPGRMEIHHLHGKVVIFDGAHNHQKMSALVASIREAFPDSEVATLVTFVKATPDRWRQTLDALTTLSHHIVVSSFALEPENSAKESVQVDEIAQYLRDKQSVTLLVHRKLQEACESLLQQPEPILLVTGSLYALSSARRLMKISSRD
jgi:dihydrofolate synthase / folylpolyglutamate synthase